MDITEHPRTVRLRLPGRAARGVLADAGLAAALLAASAVLAEPLVLPGVDGGTGSKQVHLFGSQGSWHTAAAVWWAAAVLACVALGVQRRRPGAGLFIAVAAVGCHLVDWRFPLLPIDLAAPLTLYGVSATATLRHRSVTVLVAVVTGCIGLRIASGWLIPTSAVAWSTPSDYIVPTLLVCVAWFAGDASRARRAQLVLLRQHAADLERDRDRQAALAVAAERARITRELHDVVAHGISVMVVQTQAAQAVLRRDPACAQPALDDVVALGRRSLAEMRQLLTADRSSATEAVSYTPQPGVADLADLAARVDKAGTPVRLHVEHGLDRVDAPVGLAIYRIVQEALTNTLKHAGPGASADVRVAYTNGHVEIHVTDTGGRPPRPVAQDPSPAAAGNGLRGVAERVRMLGGDLIAAERTTSGFKVHAVIPADQSLP